MLFLATGSHPGLISETLEDRAADFEAEVVQEVPIVVPVVVTPSIHLQVGLTDQLSGSDRRHRSSDVVRLPTDSRI
ncbi:MAG: hypothetical protein R3E12_13710 [Candidatus Eisenbacteria bacterium]